MTNHINPNFVHISRTVANHIVRQLGRIIDDAWNTDETGYLDRANFEIEEAQWMSAVVRFISFLRDVLVFNLDEPLPQDFIDSVVDAHLATVLEDLSQNEE